MTLNELIDDVLLEARNNQITESEKLSRYQIELWIKTYRAYLLKQKLDKGEQLDQIFYQTIRMHLDKIEEDPGHAEYQGDKELPTLLGTKLTTSVITVKDAYGNIIQLGIYKLFELFVGKKERLTMIEKLAASSSLSSSMERWGATV